MEHIKEGGTNETLVDWTQIKPAYIMVIKDTPELSKELLAEVEEYRKITGLPVKIYDEYEIEKRKNEQTISNENQEIEGAYSVKDLAPFARTKPKTSLLQKIKSFLNNKEIGGNYNEHRAD